MKTPSISLVSLLIGASCAFASDPVDSKLKAAFATAKNERVAVVGIGDSNQRFGGHGFSAAMEEALGKQFGCYGTGLINYRQPREKNAPEPPVCYEEYVYKLYTYWYIPSGESEAASWRHGLVIIPADHPMGVQGALRFHLAYGVFKGATGSFQPAVRKDAAPWTILKSEAKPISTGTDGASGLVRYTLDLSGDPTRNFPLQFMPSPMPQPVKGEFLAASAFGENLDKKSGISYSTLYAAGGQSLYDMLLKFKTLGPDRMADFFSGIRETLNGRQTCVVMICSGLNDRNEKEKSLGPHAGLASSSPEGYANNLEGLVQSLQEAWIKAGGAADTIHFAFMPSHALGDPDDPKLVSYRDAARTVAARLANASMIDMPGLVPYREMMEKRYYDKNTTTNPHLDRSGYKAISAALAEKLAE